MVVREIIAVNYIVCSANDYYIMFGHHILGVDKYNTL